MGQEKACLDILLDQSAREADGTLYEAAQMVRGNLFGHSEPLRRQNVQIIHSPELHIAPPPPADPIFSKWSAHADGPALFNALNIFLVTVASHPFTDGNGRTSRILFNLHLARRHGAGHYVPMAELAHASGGSYEELLACANQDGRYEALAEYVLALLVAYARFVLTPVVPATESHLAMAQRLAAHAATAQPGKLSINDQAPYPLSLRNVRDHHPRAALNKRLVSALVDIAQSLRRYARIDFALTELACLAAGADARPPTLAFFVHADDRQALILHARELRTRHAAVANVQIAMVTGNAVLDAKLLINISAALGCAVLLHDFD